jgi:hypothetical protein
MREPRSFSRCRHKFVRESPRSADISLESEFAGYRQPVGGGFFRGMIIFRKIRPPFGKLRLNPLLLHSQI